MSWSVSKTVEVDGEDNSRTLALKVSEALKAADRSNIGNQQCVKERDEQIDAAIRAAARLVRESGFVAAKEIMVSLSGHANQYHKNVDGWANECVTISVYATKYLE